MCSGTRTLASACKAPDALCGADRAEKWQSRALCRPCHRHQAGCCSAASPKAQECVGSQPLFVRVPCALSPKSSGSMGALQALQACSLGCQVDYR